VTSESLAAAVEEGPENPEYWRLYRRLYATTAETARRYPDDPEAWYEFGEARYHYPFFATQQEMLEAFGRSIALDSSFAPAYIHAIELALALHGPDSSRRYADAYLALEPRDVFADGVRLARLLIDPRRARSRATEEVLDTASADLLVAALEVVRPWPDSAHTAVRLASLLERNRRSSIPDYLDPEFMMAERAVSLAFRGRFREAFEVAGGRFGWIVAGAAALGALPPDTLDALFRRSLASDPLRRSLAVLAGPWWASRLDTVSLRELARRADSTARASSDQRARAFGLHVAGAARAYWALARGDTASALRGFETLTDTACARCTIDLVARARLLEAARRDREAWALLSRDPPGFIHPTHALWMLLRARVAERNGDLEAARRGYRYVADAWAGADSAILPLLRESRDALSRLSRR
jgi:serine/threonine-protein kinase